MDAIGPAELDERVRAGEELFVLDIRPESEYQSYHIDGSVNAPVYHDLTADGTALEPYLDEIPRDRPIVTVCRVGMVARNATTALEDRGYEAYTLSGGIKRWKGYSTDSLGYRIGAWVRSILG